MANWRVLERTGQTLVRLLEQRIAQAGIAGVDVRVVTTGAFSELASTASPFISLLLYQATENPERRNARRKHNTDGLLQRQPLALELCYMVTPWGARASATVEVDSSAALEEARLLGLIFQTFYDNAEVGTASLFEDPLVPVWRVGDNIQIILESLPVEDHYRIWDASELGYRLSLTYRIRVANLDSGEDESEPLVTEASFEVAP